MGAAYLQIAPQVGLICHCQLVNLLTLIFLFLCVFVANAILVHKKEGKRSASIMKNILDNP